MPRPQPNTRSNQRKPLPPPQHDVVDPVWLLKAIALTTLAALVCGYLTFCLLFYQGQWQLVLHPTRADSSPASIAGTPYELIRFGPDDSAIPQLAGWWIPAETTAPHGNATVLFVASGNGSLTDSIPTLAELHQLGLNVFAFDYRGYGQSAPSHPNQQSMIHDADAAWLYLTSSRKLSAQQIVPYGTGVGASLAVHLAIEHPTLPALILDEPHTDLLEAAKHDPRSRLLPVSLLFQQRFPLAEPLTTLSTPKLLLSRSPLPPQSFQTAAGPKIIVNLGTPEKDQYQQSLTQFLQQYLPGATPAQRAF